MITAIRHTGIVVKDLATSLRFYRDLLGLRVEKEAEEKGAFLDNMLGLTHSRVTTVKLTAPDGQLMELLQFHSHPGDQTAAGPTDVGITHLAFTVADLGQVYHTLMDQGIVFNAPPQTSPDGYARVTFCRAPEGTLIELVEVL